MFVVPADASQERLALVVGNASYRAQGLKAAASDADLVASSLRKAGFDVTAARDLDHESLAKTTFGFVDTVSKVGPDTLIAVYFGGYALQLGGETFLLPVDANTEVDEISDRSRLGVRVSDLVRALSALHPKAALVILDAARKGPFLLSGRPPADGLGWIETRPNVLVALSAPPGISLDADNGNGSYASAIAAMLSDENSAIAEAFVRVRMRVNEMTRGEQVPWHSSGIGSQLTLYARVAGTPERSVSQDSGWLRSQPMSGLSTQNAYFAALLRDTFDSYSDYLADRSNDPMAARIRTLMAVRREMLIWQRTCRAGGPEALWSYLQLYPEGPHAYDARRMLQSLNVAVAPPPEFKRHEYDIPSPLPGETVHPDSRSLRGIPPPPTPSGLLGPMPSTFITSSISEENVRQAPKSEIQVDQRDHSTTPELTTANGNAPLQSIEKQVAIPNLEGGAAKRLGVRPLKFKVPYWANSDTTSPPAEVELGDDKASRFPEWTKLGLLPQAGNVSLRGLAFTEALSSPATIDVNAAAEPGTNISLTALRPSFSEAPADVSLPGPGRIPIPVARSTALARLHGMPKRTFLSRQGQPSSTSPRQIAP